MADWFAEIDIDPAAGRSRMGVRRLGDKPWLVRDEHERHELSLKAQLCAERHDEVFAASDASERAANSVCAWIEAEGRTLVPDTTLHPLDRAGRSVQEDLCLLRRSDAGWMLEAASLCFPSRWRLADKLGRDLTSVHAPVAGYADQMADRVTHLFDRIDAANPVWRRNWFVHPDASLFQPDRPVGGDPVVPPERCLADLIVRSERQTLRRVDDTDWILFTIRIQQAPLGDLVATHRDVFTSWLDHAPDADIAHHGLSPAQVATLRHAL